MDNNLISFQVETARILDLLAKQIYQSPLALLRENAQNAFDAILMRQHLGQCFESQITINIRDGVIEIIDNGIGMSAEDLERHFWKAGSSSKNTESAKKAGVVGTFGIGAMANFGIAEKLEVETESAVTNERSFSVAEKKNLSINTKCIQLKKLQSQGQPGTSIKAVLTSSLSIGEAKAYVKQFLSFINIPLYFNGELISLKKKTDQYSSFSESQIHTDHNINIGNHLIGDFSYSFSKAGAIWLHITNLRQVNQDIKGEIVLTSGKGILWGSRNGFILSSVALNNTYQFDGIFDLPFLEPTAGREALTTSCIQEIQQIMVKITEFISLKFSLYPECDQNRFFIEWCHGHGKVDLCGKTKIRELPDKDITLEEVKLLSARIKCFYIKGSNTALAKNYISDESKVFSLATTNLPVKLVRKIS